MMRRVQGGLLFLLCVSLALGAGVVGHWDFKARASNGETYDLRLVLSETNGKLTGSLGTYDGSVRLDNLKLEGDKLSFELTVPEGTTYSAGITVEGDSMKGGYEGSDGSSGSIEAKRQKAP